MRVKYAVVLFLTFWIIVCSVEGKELALEQQNFKSKNCLIKVINGGLSVVHFYDNEKMETLRSLQGLGYLQGNDDLSSQLFVPCVITNPEVSIRLTISSITGYVNEESQCIIIALVDDSGREIAKERFDSEKYTDAVKNKLSLNTKLKTFGKKNVSVFFKFVGIKHVIISRVEIEA